MDGARLGRITRATFGFGGYDNAMIGLSLSFQGEAWGVKDFKGTWANWTERRKWTLDEQRGVFADAVELLRDTLHAAKKTDIAELVGTPVEVTFEGNVIKSWRVLTEVVG